MDTQLAYLAGAMDSDGTFTIRRSTYAVRVRGDATNPVFSERIMLKQVTPEIPTILKERFGGSLRIERPTGEKRRALFSFQATDRQASDACVALLPYLVVKKRQAETLIELRRTKDARFWKPAFWFEQNHPDWRAMEMITAAEVCEMLGYSSLGSLGQAVRNGTLLAVPFERGGKARWSGSQPRFPRLLVEQVRNGYGEGLKHRRPPELIEWRERLYAEVKRLNQVGV